MGTTSNDLEGWAMSAQVMAAEVSPMLKFDDEA